MYVEDLADTGGREGARGYHKIGEDMGDRVGCSAKRERERERGLGTHVLCVERMLVSGEVGRGGGILSLGQ